MKNATELPQKDHKEGYTDEYLRSVFTRKQYNDFCTYMESEWEEMQELESERDCFTYEDHSLPNTKIWFESDVRDFLNSGD